MDNLKCLDYYFAMQMQACGNPNCASNDIDWNNVDPSGAGNPKLADFAKLTDRLKSLLGSNCDVWVKLPPDYLNDDEDDIEAMRELNAAIQIAEEAEDPRASIALLSKQTFHYLQIAAGGHEATAS